MFHAVPSRCGEARRDLAEGGQINDTSSQKLIWARERTTGSAVCWFNFEVAVPRMLKRRTISYRLGAFRDPLITAITVIIDLLRARPITIGPHRCADASGCNGDTWELRCAAESASGKNRIWI